jgi:AraC family transcriptional regulator
MISQTPRHSPLPPLPIEPTPWKGVRVKRHRAAAGDFGGAAYCDISLAVQLSPPYRAEWREGGSWVQREMKPLDLCIVPAQVPITTRWRDEVEMLWLALDPTLVDQVAHDLKLSRCELRRAHMGVDMVLQRIGAALLREREERFEQGRAYGDALGVALAAQLLHNQGMAKICDPKACPLGSRALRRAQEFIDAHLSSDISLEEMARATGLSVFHFARSFNASTGLPPHLYLMHRRVERAVSLLLDTPTPIADVALECGFYDQSHLNRYTKRLLGVTPGQIRPPRRRVH